MTDIIELIDNAVWDTWESPDAMRWTPAGPEPGGTTWATAEFIRDQLGVEPAPWQMEVLRRALREPIGTAAVSEDDHGLNVRIALHASTPGFDGVLIEEIHRPEPATRWARGGVMEWASAPPEWHGHHVHWSLIDEMNMHGNAYVRLPPGPERRTRSMHMDYSRRLRARRRRRRS